VQALPSSQAKVLPAMQVPPKQLSVPSQTTPLPQGVPLGL
jgi:hypothetical protein